MQKSSIIIVGVLFIGLILSGFQCSSTETTSARLYIQQKNYAKAMDVLKKEVANNPKSDEGWYYLGYVYGETGNVDSMLIAFTNSLSVSENFKKEISDLKNYYWANSFNSGVNLYQRGNKTADEDSSKMFYDKSIMAFKSATLINPDSTDSYKNLAFVLMRSGRMEEAIEPFQKLIEIKHELAGYRYLGEIYYTLGINKTSSFNATGNVEDSISALENYEKAISVLEEGRSRYHDNAEIVRILNASYIGAGRNDEALESSKELAEKEPDNKVSLYNYGVILLQTEDFAGAEKQFKKALEIDPEYENAIYNLALTYVKWGTALSKQEEENEEYTGEYKKKYESALPYLEKVVKTDSENAAVWELMGKVYGVLGMQDKALDAFNNADKLK